jgi:hypothetical protein
MEGMEELERKAWREGGGMRRGKERVRKKRG